jgi:hypothetical protein
VNGSFCFFFQKEALFFFEKKNQKTFARQNAEFATADDRRSSIL